MFWILGFFFLTLEISTNIFVAFFMFFWDTHHFWTFFRGLEQYFLWAFHVLTHTIIFLVFFYHTISFEDFLLFFQRDITPCNHFCRIFARRWIRHTTTRHTNTHVRTSYTEEEEEEEGKTGREEEGRKVERDQKIVNQKQKETNNGRFWYFSTNLEGVLDHTTFDHTNIHIFNNHTIHKTQYTIHNTNPSYHNHIFTDIHVDD